MQRGPISIAVASVWIDYTTRRQSLCASTPHRFVLLSLDQADIACGVWVQRGCAPLVVSGPRIARVRKTLLARAALLGHASTDDAGLRVIAAGRALPAEVDGRTWRVRLPPGAASVSLISRTLVPAHMQADADDHRVLGVAVARLCLDGRMIALDDPRLASGWHACERGGMNEWRWTTGDATVGLAGERVLMFKVVMAGHYWLAREAA